jgi:tRNA dimethylallyltransferase
VVADRQPVKRPFDIEVRVTQIPAADLRTGIDRRVDQMMTDGLLDEVRSLLPHRHLSTLRTVGYRELFPVLDGTENLQSAIQNVKLSTWHYARKQLTWMRRYQ